MAETVQNKGNKGPDRGTHVTAKDPETGESVSIRNDRTQKAWDEMYETVKQSKSKKKGSGGEGTETGNG